MAYTIDVDAQVLRARGYAASYAISARDGAVLHRRLLQQRFATYSDALAGAYVAAQQAVSALRAEAGGESVEPKRGRPNPGQTVAASPPSGFASGPHR